jgi:hypothetical protein
VDRPCEVVADGEWSGPALINGAKIIYIYIYICFPFSYLYLFD